MDDDIGIYPGVPSIVNWISNNLAGDYKRAVGMGLHIGLGNIGGGKSTFIEANTRSKIG
jgi:hypothetical protein